MGSRLSQFHDPGTGRFLSEDPLGLAAGDTNLQRYVRNSPLSATDPTGLDIIPGLDEYEEATNGWVGDGWQIMGPPEWQEGGGDDTPDDQGDDGEEGPDEEPHVYDPIAADDTLRRHVFENPVGTTAPTPLGSCSSCTKEQKDKLLNRVKDVIQKTWIYPIGWGQCQRWVNAFESNLPWQLILNPCVTGSGQGWMKSPAIGGGHAYYYLTLCDGSTIIVDNGYKTGNDHYRIIPPGPWPFPGLDPRPGRGRSDPGRRGSCPKGRE